MSKEETINHEIITKYNNSDNKNDNNNREMGVTLPPTKIAYCTLNCKKIFYEQHAQASANKHMLGEVCFLFICIILSDV